MIALLKKVSGVVGTILLYACTLLILMALVIMLLYVLISADERARDTPPTKPTTQRTTP